MILLTGATGFLGRSVLPAMLRSKWLVRPMVRDKSKYKEIFPKGPGPIVSELSTLRRGDLATENVGGLVHLASEVWPVERKDAAEFTKTNVAGSKALLDAIDHRMLKRVVLVSTFSVYGEFEGSITELHKTRPENSYSRSKLAQEEIFYEFGRRYDIPVAILRMSSIYGNGQYTESVLPRFVNDALQNRTLTITGPPTRTQNFIYVEDAAAAVVAALERAASGIYNIGGPGETTLRELADTILAVTGARARAIERPTAGTGSVRPFHFEIEKAARELEWTPRYNLEDGLRAMLAAQ